MISSAGEVVSAQDSAEVRRYRRWLEVAEEAHERGWHDTNQLIGIAIGTGVTIGLTTLAILNDGSPPPNMVIGWGAPSLVVLAILAASKYVKIRDRSLRGAIEANLFRHILEEGHAPKRLPELLDEVQRRTHHSTARVWQRFYGVLEDPRFRLRAHAERRVRAADEPAPTEGERPLHENYFLAALLAFVLVVPLFVSVENSIRENDVTASFPLWGPTLAALAVVWFVLRFLTNLLYSELSVRPERRGAVDGTGRIAVARIQLQEVARKLYRRAWSQNLSMLAVAGLSLLPLGSDLALLALTVVAPMWIIIAIRARRTLRPKLVSALSDFLWQKLDARRRSYGLNEIQAAVDDSGVEDLDADPILREALRKNATSLLVIHEFEAARHRE